MSVTPRTIGRSVGRRLTYANVASTAALFLALSTGTAYAANTIFSTDIVDGEVKNADLGSNAVTTNKIGNGQVRVADLGADAVTTDKVLDGTLTAADLGFGSVTSDSVLDESLTSADLATNSVDATEIADNSIDTGEIVNDSLFAADLAPGSVGTSEVTDDSLTAGDLGASSVGSSEVLNNSLTTADIAGADVNGGAINVPAGYVPNGRCRQLDAGVGGALAGQAVVFSIQAALQDGVLIYGQRVPSDGHVTFSVCNFSGTTQTAISSMPVRIITWG